MRNIKLTIKYDGSRYKGWQRQENTDMTVQEKIENVLKRITNENIEIIGSGRTDAGVHAIGQVANFKTESDMSLKEIKKYFSIYLPDDIVIDRVEEVEERFHSRYNAISKKYLYKIWNGDNLDPFSRKYSVHIEQSLNLEKMRKGAGYLIGEHDFTSFTTDKSKKKSKVRTIYSIDITKNDKSVEILFHGNGFLYNMVRIIVATLIDVGLEKSKPENVLKILEGKNRALAGDTAVAKGLYLLEVEYKNSKNE
ncbi:tRNA pseudouridine synthase A [Gottschalkia acidurici 9a]|uniref:tRNA pseudouridine synthase A n=1 Tax=Gottschalkia acidurici (strain ATCC 7906 / DSM 604 / BCRC 14475 / CIP 104303 / KCTC 5404 / NCIMB 10678 / 9a) TaxID=1128398 RepID=K0AY89_GOTA9|nr:tRNA pseudouridine(38-40) synthase TruA [Gottschalkia acidurici]AFS77725.1 tRNA pseudouridine synthase A [Gottschalkia acidurici 9a]